MFPFDDVFMINQGGCGHWYWQLLTGVNYFAADLNLATHNKRQNVKTQQNGIEWV